jgi:hypothetical protein
MGSGLLFSVLATHQLEVRPNATAKKEKRRPDPLSLSTRQRGTGEESLCLSSCVWLPNRNYRSG